ncbi:MAG: ribbon-helix-helix protein, CopG family [Hyphomicrobium sp.]|nr:ribbon-helix-helix protein, CopG family [Hyphomicrobium sp.]
MARYIALVDGAESTWGVRIPDFPGCFGAGATMDAAVDDATRALREFAADMVADGEALPAPRSWQDIKAELAAEGEPIDLVVYIPLLLDKARPVRANISLDAGLLETIDREARARGLTRSAFLASAAVDKIAAGR